MPIVGEGTPAALAADAADAAATAAAAAAAWSGPGDGVAPLGPLADQARTILGAALQVVEAVRFLCWEAAIELARWISLHPLVLYALVGGPVSYTLFVAVRRYVNLSWEQGLKDARTTRKFAKAGTEFTDIFDDDPGAESEDDARVSTSPDRSRDWAKARSPTVTEKFMGVRGIASPTLAARPSPTSLFPAAALPTGEIRVEPAELIRQIRVMADLDEDCLEFLLSHLKVLAFGPGEVVFEHGAPRDAFLVVKAGQVAVEVSPARPADNRRSEDCVLQAGDTAVGLLFVLASLCAEGSGVDGGGIGPPEACTLHSRTARAGNSGAEVVALPTSAFSEAFDKFPYAMQSMVRRLCVRHALVVFETLSTYFGLRQEILVPSTYMNVKATREELADLSPQEVFARFLGADAKEGNGKRSKGIQEALASASTQEFEEGQFVVSPHQRSGHLFVLLDGELQMHKEDNQSPPSGGDPADLTFSSSVGKVWGRQPGSSAPHLVNVGEAIGEMSILADRPSHVVYQCLTRCRFAALPRDAAQKLLELCPRTWCLRLLHLIAARTASWLHRVDAALDWLPVEGGQCLYRRGDPTVGFFVVLSGRLIALEESELEGRTMVSHPSRSPWQVSDVLQRGRLCGEIDCLRDTPYSHTVRASRDSEVCRVSSTVLHLIAMDFPKAILHFSSLVGPRAQGGQDVRQARHKTTIAVVPASKDVNVQDVCARLTAALGKLGKTLQLSSNSDLSCLPGSSGARSQDGSRLGRLFAELEMRFRWLVYEAEPPHHGRVTDWTRRCIRQADHILVAVNFDGSERGDVPETVNERYMQEAGLFHVERDLLLLHATPPELAKEGRRRLVKDDWFASAARAGDTLRPGLRGFVAHHTTQLFFGHRKGKALRSTRHYLHTRPWARRWHHVRLGDPTDWARCARLLAGRGIGICLGGGGARGNCHFGVIRAFQELGIPIDVVSGTSFGALAGAIYSMTAPQPGSMMRVVRGVMGTKFSTRKMLMDLNFPRTSYFTGFYLNGVLKDTFARRRCEDLLVPFACPSTDIVSFDAKMHREGPLWRIVRASMSLVGFVPPLPYQERRTEDGSVVSSLLVDGGYVNQYPIEVLKEHGAGVVVCIKACPDYSPVNTDYGDVVRGGLITLRRTFCCRRRSAEAVVDPPTQAEIQERLMFLVENMKESETSRSDLMLYPEIQSYGLLDFAKYEEIADVGYREALPRLKEFIARDCPAAQHVREVIESTKADEHVRASMNEVEYGGRQQYAKWRAARRRASQLVESGRALLTVRERLRSGARRRNASPGDSADGEGDGASSCDDSLSGGRRGLLGIRGRSHSWNAMPDRG